MAQTVARGSGNYYSNSLTDGYIPGDAATGHVLRYIDGFVDALEPYDTPFLSTIGIGAELDNPKPEWGQRYQMPHRVTLDSNLTNVATTMVVDTGQGAYLQQYMVLKILDSTNGDEIVWIDQAPADWTGADSPDIIRAQGGTVGVAHTAPLTVEVIGVAEPATVDHAESPYNFGDLQYNRFQRFGGMIPMDNLGRVTPNHEIKGDQLVERIKEQAKLFKLQLEKAVVHGRRQVGTPDESAKRPDMMGGIGQFLTTNVTDLNGAALTVASLEEATADVWDLVDTNLATTLYMNMNTKRILSRLLEPIRFTNMTPSQTSVDTRFTRVTLDTGTFNFVVSRYMPDGEIWGLNPRDLKIHPYKDSRWSIRELATQGDYSKQAIHGVYTLIFKRERAAFRIHDFDTTLSNYSLGL
jgi:hypothetical protein